MNFANLLFIVLIIVVAVLGCSSPNEQRSAKSRQPAPTDQAKLEPKQVLSIKDVIKRSPSQIEKTLGKPTGSQKLTPKPDFNYDLSLDYPWGFINFRNNTSTYIHYESPVGYDNFFPLGKEVGVDFFAVEPSSSNGFAVIYKNVQLNGIRFSEVRIVPGLEKKYQILTFKTD